MSDVGDYLSGLNQLRKDNVSVFYSRGARGRASYFSETANRSYLFLKEFFKSDIEIRVLVLDKDDWEKRRCPYPYGAAFSGKGCVHFPKDNDTPFIDMLMKETEGFPEDQKALLSTLVEDEDSALRTAFQRLIDLLIMHEMTHAFCSKENVVFGQRWFNEFFAQYTSYAFLKRYESENPMDLKFWTILYNVCYEAGKPLVKHKSIEDFEEIFYDVGPLNYVWYQAKFVEGTKAVYDRYGENFIDNVIEVFKVTPNTLVQRLEESCEGIRNWYTIWKKELE